MVSVTFVSALATASRAWIAICEWLSSTGVYSFTPDTSLCRMEMSSTSNTPSLPCKFCIVSSIVTASPGTGESGELESAVTEPYVSLVDYAVPSTARNGTASNARPITSTGSRFSVLKSISDCWPRRAPARRRVWRR